LNIIVFHQCLVCLGYHTVRMINHYKHHLSNPAFSSRQREGCLSTDLVKDLSSLFRCKEAVLDGPQA
jgi:hypothetical protein